MPEDTAEETVANLAEALGSPLPLEHLAEVAASWRLMAPHLARVRAAELEAELEPASLFRP
jgi:hypothetical protein